MDNNHSEEQPKKNMDYPNPIPEEILKFFKKEIRKKLKTITRKEKVPHGEPRRYNKNMCYKILDLFAQGKSKNAVSTELGISRQSFYIWTKQYPEFAFACKIGEQLSERWWAEAGRLNLMNKNFNHILWMMNMSNRFNYKTSNTKEEKKIKRIDKKILEFKLNDDRIARILNLARNNKTIAQAREFIEDQQAVYTD